MNLVSGEHLILHCLIHPSIESKDLASFIPYTIKVICKFIYILVKKKFKTSFYLNSNNNFIKDEKN